ncbi:MAG TPA: glycosyl hydrolase family 28 protein [Candidatus Acidoferrales bacterium]|nr:glycosyl hydrolase family 28 protein [Candidatus Acidoferrales bacterium]
MIPVFARVAGMGLLFLLVSATCGLAQSPALPNIPANSFNITTFGAVGDGLTTNTTAIQNTINAAFAAGGGTVEFPSGIYLSGPLNFSNSINLQLDAGAILRMLPYGSYPGGSSPADFITSASSGGHDLEVSGTGTIDGQAENSGWWTNNLSTSARPILLYFNKCNRVLIQNVTLENPPSMHLVFKSSGGNITIQGITINTSSSSPNTDGIDLVGTNCLVENSSISDGDDCIAFGSTAGTSSGTLVTNCNFGFGHGLSIGGNTAAGVSNLTVVNCTFNGTQYGIRMKSDNASSSPGSGGITQNLFYSNLTMTNIMYGAIVIYSYYNEPENPINATPAFAASEAIPSPVPTTTCVWRNIVISNVTASVKSSGIAGVIWGRTEMPVTNVSLMNVNITAPKTFNVYNAYGFQFANSAITLPAGNSTFAIYNAGLVLTNATNVTLSGLTSTNSLALYNSSASTTATDLFGADPITLSGSTLTVSNNYIVPQSTVFDFGVGTNASTVRAVGNLTFGSSTINVTNSVGFGPGTYNLFTYTGNKSGTYALGAVPPNFDEALTNSTGEIQLVVTGTGPSLTPVSLVCSNAGGGLNVSWPQDHTGWYLQIQTNKASAGLGNNWITVPASAMTNQFSLPINPANGCVFLRLEYP